MAFRAPVAASAFAFIAVVVAVPPPSVSSQAHVDARGRTDHYEDTDHDDIKAVRRQAKRDTSRRPQAGAAMQTDGALVSHADFLFDYPLPLPSLCQPSAGTFAKAATKKIENQPSNKNVAVLVRGESFRNGGRGHREYCDDKTDSAEWQRAAVKNHLHMMVHPLEEKGHKVDVFLATYRCPAKRASWNDDLVKWYGINLRGHSSIVRAPNQTQSTTVRELFKLFRNHTAKSHTTYEGGVVLLRFDFYFLKPFTQFMAFKHFGDKLMVNEWGGGDVFFTLPWYFMNCFAGTLEQNCWDNQFFSGTPCYYGLKANLINPQGQSADPFLSDPGCTPACPALPQRPSFVIHPWSIWKHQRDEDLRRCNEACSVLVATTPDDAPRICHVQDGCAKLCGNAGCSMDGPVFGPR